MLYTRRDPYMCRAVRKERAPRLNSERLTESSLAAFRRVDLFLYPSSLPSTASCLALCLLPPLSLPLSSSLCPPPSPLARPPRVSAPLRRPRPDPARLVRPLPCPTIIISVFSSTSIAFCQRIDLFAPSVIIIIIYFIYLHLT